KLQRSVYTKSTKINPPVPPKPSECCNSNCPNCVWIVFGEKLEKHFENEDESKNEYLKKLIKDTNDPLSKIFIQTFIK
ncbi:MAG: hypothetical protein MHPSP_004814, partial [Paramarteilia canceri]